LYFFLIQVFFFLIPLQLLLFNMPKTDLSQVYIGDMLGADFLNPLPAHAILLVGGDTALFNTWYMHYARHVRSDVVLINLSLATMDPYIQKEENLVKKQFPKAKDNELVAKTLLAVSQKRPVFSYEQLQAPGNTKLSWIPTGLVYQLSADGSKPEKFVFLKNINNTMQKIHTPLQKEKNYKNFTIADIPLIYAKSTWAVGNYLLNTYKDPDTALDFYKKALTISPTFESPYITSGLVYLTSKNDCKNAEFSLKESLRLAPYDEFPYFLLYTTYTECYHDKKKAQNVIKEFEEEFGLKFFDELAKNLNLAKK